MKQTPAHWKVGKNEKALSSKRRLLEGLPVTDSNSGLVLHIKKCDVLGSTKADASNCAAARALKREMGSEARVFLTRTYVKVGKRWQRFITPESISREIVAFDRGASFETGEYILNAPPRTLRLDYRPKPTGPKTRKSGKQTKPRHVTASVRKMK